MCKTIKNPKLVPVLFIYKYHSNIALFGPSLFDL